MTGRLPRRELPRATGIRWRDIARGAGSAQTHIA